ncbi:MAG: GTPase, partial [Fimbriimonadaceae bacterium]
MSDSSANTATIPRSHWRIAIVGRPNVGKSAIFNRLARRRIAIVHDQPGVTRDRIAAEIEIEGILVELTDTGGIGASLDDGFAQQVRMEADIAIAASDLILFVVDARTGIHPIDRDLASVLRKSGKDILLLVNKVDTEKTDPDTAEFVALGFRAQVNVSAEHGRNFSVLTSDIATHLSKKGAERGDGRQKKASSRADSIKIAIVGRPNVGK